MSVCDGFEQLLLGANGTEGVGGHEGLGLFSLLNIF